MSYGTKNVCLLKPIIKISQWRIFLSRGWVSTVYICTLILGPGIFLHTFSNCPFSYSSLIGLVAVPLVHIIIYKVGPELQPCCQMRSRLGRSAYPHRSAGEKRIGPTAVSGLWDKVYYLPCFPAPIWSLHVCESCRIISKTLSAPGCFHNGTMQR